MDPIQVYTRAARAFAELVGRIPDGAWDGPGLGEWDLRALVGHTSRSLTTVITYFSAPAERIDVEDPVQYYRIAAEMTAAEGAGVVERGRVAGQQLGADPAAHVNTLAEHAVAVACGPVPAVVAVLSGLGMRPIDYLPTRIFELAVHSVDIADAAGIPLVLDPDVATAALALATQIAVDTGSGDVVLRALTGRAALPNLFSVTP